MLIHAILESKHIIRVQRLTTRQTQYLLRHIYKVYVHEEEQYVYFRTGPQRGATGYSQNANG